MSIFNCAPLEERLLSDGEFYEEVLIAEDELIDHYLSNDLSPSERERFETHFLIAPERQQKVRFGRTLKRCVSVADPYANAEAVISTEDRREVVARSPWKFPFPSFLPVRNPMLSYALAAAVLLMVCGVSWVVWKNWWNPASHQPAKVFSAVLTPGLVREGGETKRLAIPAETDTVRLLLKVAKVEHASYRARLLGDDRSEKWASDRLLNEPGESLIVADVPAKVLTPGDYEIKLTGQFGNGSFEDLAGYRFRVTR